MQARATWKGGFETHLEDGRGHRVTVDLPVDEGGRDVGTSALELMVLSLAGCISTIFALIAEKRKLTYDGMTISLTAVRPRGAPTITKVEGRIAVQSAAAQGEVETVVRLTVRTCPVGALLERAHVPIEVEVVVTPPSLAAKQGSDPGHVSPEPG